MARYDMEYHKVISYGISRWPNMIWNITMRSEMEYNDGLMRDMENHDAIGHRFKSAQRRGVHHLRQLQLLLLLGVLLSDAAIRSPRPVVRRGH
jgi:hypothetical protein